MCTIVEFYKKCIEVDLHQFAEQFNASVIKIGNRVSLCSSKKVCPEIPQESPETLAQNYISDSFPSVDVVLSSVKYIISLELAMEPRIKSKICDIYFKGCSYFKTFDDGNIFAALPSVLLPLKKE
jgi:transcriptional accessory protein Tex/SPT6